MLYKIHINSVVHPNKAIIQRKINIFWFLLYRFLICYINYTLTQLFTQIRPSYKERLIFLFFLFYRFFNLLYKLHINSVVHPNKAIIQRKINIFRFLFYRFLICCINYTLTQLFTQIRPSYRERLIFFILPVLNLLYKLHINSVVHPNKAIIQRKINIFWFLF